jgi:fluoroquinolone resistance protein
LDAARQPGIGRLRARLLEGVASCADVEAIHRSVVAWFARSSGSAKIPRSRLTPEPQRMDIDALARTIRAAEPVQALRLSDNRWPELDCQGASFADCLLERIQFSNPILREARFTNCRFVSCRFSHAELQDARFEGCGFAGEDKKGCSFAFSNLQRAAFIACDLSLTAFDRTELFAIEMRDCNLTGASFTKVDFSRALSRKRIETRANFHACKMDFADLSEARLPACSLAGSRLREADLSGADLTDADFSDCDLFQAILDGAKLSGADLTGAEVSGLNLTTLADFAGLKVSDDQMFRLLDAMGISVRVRER